MPKLNLLIDLKNGEPVIKNLVSAENAKKSNYLAIRAYNNKKEKEVSADIGEK